MPQKETFFPYRDELCSVSLSLLVVVASVLAVAFWFFINREFSVCHNHNAACFFLRIMAGSCKICNSPSGLSNKPLIVVDICQESRRIKASALHKAKMHHWPNWVQESCVVIQAMTAFLFASWHNANNFALSASMRWRSKSVNSITLLRKRLEEIVGFAPVLSGSFDAGWSENVN